MSDFSHTICETELDGGFDDGEHEFEHEIDGRKRSRSIGLHDEPDFPISSTSQAPKRNRTVPFEPEISPEEDVMLDLDRELQAEEEMLQELDEDIHEDRSTDVAEEAEDVIETISVEPSRATVPLPEVHMQVGKIGSRQFYGPRELQPAQHALENLGGYSLLTGIFASKPDDRNTWRRYYGFFDNDAELGPIQCGKAKLFDEDPTLHTYTDAKEVKKRICQRIVHEQLSLESVIQHCPAFAEVYQRTLKQCQILRAHQIPFFCWFTGGKGFRVVVQDNRLWGEGTMNRDAAVRDILMPYLRVTLGWHEFDSEWLDKNVYDSKKGVKPDFLAHPDTKLFPVNFSDILDNKDYLKRLLVRNTADPALIDTIKSFWTWVASNVPVDVPYMVLPPAVPLHIGDDDEEVDPNRTRTAPHRIKNQPEEAIEPADPRYSLLEARAKAAFDISSSPTRIVKKKKSVYWLLFGDTKRCLLKKGDHSKRGKTYIVATPTMMYFACHSASCTKAKRITKSGALSLNDKAILFPEEYAFVEEYNREYAVVLINGKCRIMEPNYRNIELGIHELRFFTFNDFFAWKSNDRTHRRNEEKARIWTQHPDRRQYSKIVFMPGKKEEELPPNVYNLWRGWGCEAKEGCWDRIRQHIFEIICARNQEKFDYVINWLALMVQNPSRLPGTALILRGKEGTGKGVFIVILAGIVGTHYRHITHSKHLTGKFNGFMRECVLAFADEAMWAGDKEAEGALKGIITEPDITIEYKGIDPSRARSNIHVAMASNEDWVVPAGKDARRFVVLDVADTKRQDHAYFEELTTEIESGGREAFFYFLLHHSIDDFRPQVLPQACNDALWENKLYTLSSLEKWWYSVLHDGYMSPPNAPTQQLGQWIHSDMIYESFKVTKPSGYILSKEEFFKKLKKIVPNMHRMRETDDNRPRGYVFPSLRQCQQDFQLAVNTDADILWR